MNRRGAKGCLWCQCRAEDSHSTAPPPPLSEPFVEHEWSWMLVVKSLGIFGLHTKTKRWNIIGVVQFGGSTNEQAREIIGLGVLWSIFVFDLEFVFG